MPVKILDQRMLVLTGVCWFQPINKLSESRSLGKIGENWDLKTVLTSPMFNNFS
jgi:hypothetical protein